MAELEEVFEATSVRVRELGDDVSTLKSVSLKQEKSISALKNLKEHISKDNEKRVKEMDELMEVQREQVESFNSTSGALRQSISEEVDEKIEKRFEQLAQESRFQHLREQAFRSRFNLVITGLPEED